MGSLQKSTTSTAFDNRHGDTSDLIEILRDGLAAHRDPGEDPKAAAGRRRPPPLTPPHRLREVEEPRRLHHLEEPAQNVQVPAAQGPHVYAGLSGEEGGRGGLHPLLVATPQRPDALSRE